MERISSSLQDVVSRIQATSASSQTEGPQTMEPSGSKDFSDSQVWQTAGQLSEVAPITSPLGVEQLRPFLNIPELEAIDSKLPTRDILEEVVELFFELIYPSVPIFYKPNFMANLFSPGRQLLLHGIVVVALRFWKKTEPSAEMRENYMKISREQILLSTN
jgi:hypothetical protein